MRSHSTNHNGRILSLFLSAICVGIWISGCSVGPDYERPEVETQDAWSQSILEDFQDGTPQLQQWWTNFNDPKLHELVERTISGNLDLQQAFSRIEEARYLRNVARGQWFPDVDGTGAAMRNRSSDETVPAIPPGLNRTDNFFSVGVDSSWEIDVWGRIRRSVESADAAIEATVEDYRDVLVLLCAEVGVNYFEYRVAQERIQLTTKNRDAQRETLKLTQGRNEAGLVPDLDIKQAELNLARTESLLPELGQTLAVSRHRLAVLLGESPSALNEELSTLQPLPEAPLDVYVGLPANLLRQRPDVRRAERLLAAQTARIGVAKADLYPRLSLLGSFAFEAADAGNVFEGGSRAYSFGPAIRWNLFDAGRVRSLWKAEESRADQAFISYQQSILLALEEVENLMVLYAEERDRLGFLGQAVTAAQGSVDLVLALYKEGLTEFQNVLQMERLLFEEENREASSRGILLQDLVRLYKALGGGWGGTEEW